MKIIALNGSPRKGWNTHQMLEAFLEGARAADAETETELVHLFDLSYTGCRSCFACKRKGGPSSGRCAYPDGARELLAAGENVTETARAAGYDDPLEFSRFFKKHTGLSPSAYAAQERRGQ